MDVKVSPEAEKFRDHLALRGGSLARLAGFHVKRLDDLRATDVDNAWVRTPGKEHP